MTDESWKFGPDKLPDKLRASAGQMERGFSRRLIWIFYEAATEIERLRKRISELEKEPTEQERS